MEAERVLLKWMKTPVGQLLQREIQQHIYSQIGKPSGSYLLSLGLPDSSEMLQDLQIPFKWSISEGLNEPIYFDGMAHFDALPFQNELFDFVILAYPGFYQNDMNLLFQEIERVLAPDGQLILFDVNPISMLGTLFKKFVSKNNSHYQFRSLNPVCRNIKQYAFCIDEIDTFFYRFPKQDEVFLKRMRFMETLAPLLLFVPAGFYSICAKKVNYNVISIADKWRVPVESAGEVFKLIS